MTLEEKRACAEGELLKFVFQNTRYPSLAVQNGVEGTIVIGFVVERDGDPVEYRDSPEHWRRLWGRRQKRR